MRLAQWQHELLEDRTSLTIWLHGGLGSGKTFGAILKHYNWVTENLNCKFSWFVEPTYHKIDTIAIPGWRDLFEILKLKEGKHYRFFKSKPQSLEIYSGKKTHKIWFQSADRPHLMVGDNIGYFTLDEAGDSKFEAYERSSQRLRAKTANYLQAVICGAPQGMNWFADYANYDGPHPEKNERSIEIWTEDNLHNLDPNYIDRQLNIFGHNKAKVASWLYGKFTSFFEGIAHPEYDPERDRHNLDPDPHAPITICWDWNVQPLAWVAVQKRWVETPYGREIKYCTVGESSGEQRLIVDACVEFIARFDPDIYGRTPIRIDGDATGRASSIRGKGNNFDEVEKVLKAYYQDVRVIVGKHNPLVTQRVEVLNKAFSYSKFLIHKNDKKTSRSFQEMKWKEGGKVELEKPSGETVTHFGEAVSYHIYRELKADESGRIKAPGVVA